MKLVLEGRMEGKRPRGSMDMINDLLDESYWEMKEALNNRLPKLCLQRHRGVRKHGRLRKQWQSVVMGQIGLDICYWNTSEDFPRLHLQTPTLAIFEDKFNYACKKLCT